MLAAAWVPSATVQRRHRAARHRRRSSVMAVHGASSGSTSTRQGGRVRQGARLVAEIDMEAVDCLDWVEKHQDRPEHPFDYEHKPSLNR